MASAETRDVVKRYELQVNALVSALRPGGLLANVEVRSPCEALLVPREVSLDAIKLLPFLQAKLQRPHVLSPRSPAPPLSDLFGEGHDTPMRQRPGIGGSDKKAVPEQDTSPSRSGLYYTPENEEAFRVALTTFLEYHLLHFGGFGNSEFTTLRGQRGAFSEDLDYVKRFGYIGQVAVLADADPLQPISANGGKAKAGNASSAAVQGKEKVFHPSSLQVFIIDRPLMDTAEIRPILETLRKLTAPEVAVAKVNARLDALFADQGSSSVGQQPPPASHTADLPFLMRVESHTQRAATAAAAPKLPKGNFTDKQSSPGPKSASTYSPEAASDNESVAETIIIDDFEEDVPDEPDLAPYVHKYTQMSERQRRQREANQLSEVNADGAAVVTGRVVTAPTASPSSASVTASRAASVEDHSTSSRGRVVSVTLATASPKSGRSGYDIHTNVVRHEYSREIIKNYRRVVAADNEINYHVFEHLMALQCSAPLAKLMSGYVSKSQQLQQPILNNVKYNAFVEACHTAILQVPRFAKDAWQRTTLQEGLERYVTSRLYHQIYSVCEDENQQSAILQAKLLRLENMTAGQLDALPEVERHHVWGQAMFELDGMNFFKSPREKLRCGMRACELLSLTLGDVLRQRRNAKNASGGKNHQASSTPSGGVALAFGADEFLPCFLLLVLRARPLHYVHNVAYIEKFRYASLMSPEESYCFATVQSAMMFWLNCKDDGRMESTPSPPKASPSRQEAAKASAAATAAVRDGQASRGGGNAGARSSASAPQMTEKDLLPSVRQASYAARANSNFTQDGAPLAEGTVLAQDEAPTMLDVLFGWANRNLAPIADELGRVSGTRKAAEAAGSASPGEPHSPSLSTASAAAAGGGEHKRDHQAVAGGRFSLHADGDMAVPSSSKGLPPSPPQPHQPRQPDANTRAHVRELLVTQRKTFEQLTLTEIQMIVEEARQLLSEKE